MIEIISIIIEVVIVITALVLAITKRKTYGYGFALTFAIYVLFDSNRQFGLEIPQATLDVLFLAASISALWSILLVYRSTEANRI